VKSPLLVTSNKFDLLDELQRQCDDDDDEEGYTLDKELILQAWCRYRPVNKPDLMNVEDVFGYQTPRDSAQKPHKMMQL